MVKVIKHVFARRIDEIAVDIFFDLRTRVGREALDDGIVDFIAGGEIAAINFRVTKQLADHPRDFFDAAFATFQPDVVPLAVGAVACGGGH